MADCTSLTANILKDCDNPIVNGIDADVYLANYTDWDNATKTLDATDGFITDFTLPSGATLYKVESDENAVQALTEFIRSATSSNFAHQVAVNVPKDTQGARNEVSKLLKSRVVAIIRQNYAGGDNTGKFKVFGSKTGLRGVAQVVQDSSNTDVNGAYTIALRTDDGNGIYEPEPPVGLLVTSIADTAAKLESLLSATDV